MQAASIEIVNQDEIDSPTLRVNWIHAFFLWFCYIITYGVCSDDGFQQRTKKCLMRVLMFVLALKCSYNIRLQKSACGLLDFYLLES